MATTAAQLPWGWLLGHLRGRDITVAGIAAATLKVSLQQVAGQAALSFADALPLHAAGSLDWLVGVLAGLAAVVNGWTFGLAGVALLLVLPVGGPVWAGVVPVGATVAGARNSAGWVASTVRLPASRNVSPRRVTDTGPVPLTILIVDDSAPFRELARTILIRDGLDVVGTAASAAEAVASVSALRPAVALVDVNLGADSGFDLARRLAGDPTPVTTVLMSTHAEDELAELVAGSPAAGFVPKEQLSGEAVRALVAGRV